MTTNEATAVSTAAWTPVARRAAVGDAREIRRLIQFWADETGDVLPRTEGEIYETIRDFVVVDGESGRSLVAAGALHVEWRDLAEIKSLVVDRTIQGKGLGRIVVASCLDEAVELGLKTVFALTTTPGLLRGGWASAWRGSAHSRARSGTSAFAVPSTRTAMR